MYQPVPNHNSETSPPAFVPRPLRDAGNILEQPHRICFVFYYPYTDVQMDTCTGWLGYRLNQLEAWYTSTPEHPDKRFSHVELLMEDGKSYSIRWGGAVHAESRDYTNKPAYAFLEQIVSAAHYSEIHSLCRRGH